MNPELSFKKMEKCRYYWSYDFIEFEERHEAVIGFVFDMSRDQAEAKLNDYVIKITKAQVLKAVEQ